MILASSIYTVYLFISSSSTEHDYGTMKAIEYAPITKILLVICTHIVLAFFARKMYNGFVLEKTPVSPSLFVFIIGKLFMIPRLIMAYSSGNYGHGLEFFIWEELLLIIIQMTSASILFPRLNLSYDCTNIIGQERVWKAVLVLDTFKTFTVFLLWLTYKPGALSSLFNRIDGFGAQVFLFIGAHILMDTLQSVSTIFSLYIAKLCSKAEEETTVNEYQKKSYMLNMCHWMEQYFIKNVFMHTDLVENANTYCNLLDMTGCSCSCTTTTTTCHIK